MMPAFLHNYLCMWILRYISFYPIFIHFVLQNRNISFCRLQQVVNSELLTTTINARAVANAKLNYDNLDRVSPSKDQIRVRAYSSIRRRSSWLKIVSSPLLPRQWDCLKGMPISSPTFCELRFYFYFYYLMLNYFVFCLILFIKQAYL